MNKVIERENFRYKQLVTASSVAKITAASPPKNKNARKIAASEKLIAKFERGNIMLSRVLTDKVKTKRATNPQSIIWGLKFKIANAKHTPPKAVMPVLKNVEIFSRFINEKNFVRGIIIDPVFVLFLRFEVFSRRSWMANRRDLTATKILPKK